jgi:hypothetical protein
MRPRPSISTPASSRPRPSVFPTRPDAKSTLSGLISSPSASLQLRPLSSRLTAALPPPSTSLIPKPEKTSLRSCEISASRNERMRSPESTSVTLTPSAVKIDAYSHPTAPPPTTTRLSKGRSMTRTVSESRTSGSSKGMLGGRNGRDPVAISTTSPWSARSCPSPRVTRTVRSKPSLALPQTNSTA